MNPTILRTPAAAAHLALSTSTLEKLRVVGGGPPFVRLGARAVGYDVRDLDAWLAGRKRSSTSDLGMVAMKGGGRPRRSANRGDES